MCAGRGRARAGTQNSVLRLAAPGVILRRMASAIAPAAPTRSEAHRRELVVALRPEPRLPEALVALALALGAAGGTAEAKAALAMLELRETRRA